MRYEMNIVCRGDDFDARYDAVLRLWRMWAKVALMRHLGEEFVLCLSERPDTIIRDMPDECPEHTVVLGLLVEERLTEGNGTLFTLTARKPGDFLLVPVDRVPDSEWYHNVGRVVMAELQQ